MSVEQKVKQIIVEQLGVDEAQVDSTASFVDDLGADSLDIVELVMASEEAFDLDIPDEDAEKILSAAIRVAGGELVSARDLVRALELLIDSGLIQPKNVAQSTQLEEPAEDTRPRDKNGKLLTTEQIGRAMIAVATRGAAKQILEPKDINAIVPMAGAV